MNVRARRIFTTAALFAIVSGGVVMASPAGAVTPKAGGVYASVVRPSGFACSAWGYGATLAEAQEQAREMWVGNRVYGTPAHANGQYPDGTWWAEIYGDCYVIM